MHSAQEKAGNHKGEGTFSKLLAHPAVIHLPCPQQDAFVLHQEQTDAPRGKKKPSWKYFSFVDQPHMFFY